jgi:hypothetical protein
MPLDPGQGMREGSAMCWQRTIDVSAREISGVDTTSRSA